jgi:hypothetical protein
VSLEDVDLPSESVCNDAVIVLDNCSLHSRVVAIGVGILPGQRDKLVRQISVELDGDP